MKRSLKFLLIVVLFNMLNSCEQESSTSIIGTWVSENKADTLYFINNHTFNRSLIDGIQHTYDYSINEDSITILYKGPDKIWVMAAAHYYKLYNNELMIDFTNHCYFFEPEKKTYIKK